MPGPSPKPRDQRARRNATEGTTSTSVILDDVGALTVSDEQMKPTRRWLKATKEAWEIIWEVPEAQMLRPHHIKALRRLYNMYDDEERLRREVNRSHVVAIEEPLGLDGPAVEGEAVLETEVRARRVPGYMQVGSQGQLVESVASKKLDRVAREIRQMEDRLAGTPMAQFRLGWQQAAMLNEQARAADAVAIATAAAELQREHEVQVLGHERDT